MRIFNLKYQLGSLKTVDSEQQCVKPASPLQGMLAEYKIHLAGIALGATLIGSGLLMDPKTTSAMEPAQERVFSMHHEANHRAAIGSPIQAAFMTSELRSDRAQIWSDIEPERQEVVMPHSKMTIDSSLLATLKAEGDYINLLRAAEVSGSQSIINAAVTDALTYGGLSEFKEALVVLQTSKMLDHPTFNTLVEKLAKLPNEEAYTYQVASFINHAPSSEISDESKAKHLSTLVPSLSDFQKIALLGNKNGYLARDGELRNQQVDKMIPVIGDAALMRFLEIEQRDLRRFSVEQISLMEKRIFELGNPSLANVFSYAFLDSNRFDLSVNLKGLRTLVQTEGDLMSQVMMAMVHQNLMSNDEFRDVEKRVLSSGAPSDLIEWVRHTDRFDADAVRDRLNAMRAMPNYFAELEERVTHRNQHMQQVVEHDKDIETIFNSVTTLNSNKATSKDVLSM